MHLVELLLPLFDNDGNRLPAALYRQTRDELVSRFGGLTAFSRAPAEGLWEKEPGQVVRDEVVIFEVMVEEIDRAWWAECRRRLEARFRQETIVIRSTRLELL
jgi:hypothetical protein